MTPPLREYEGFDLALGEIYGLRVWLVDEYGRLRARHLTSVAPPWRPGVNTATCLLNAVAQGGAVVGPGSARNFLAAVMASCTCESCAGTPKPPDHPAPTEACKCGFYAYTGPGHELYIAGGVVGVIRGSGRTLIGAKGFRSEKAEIVALLDPASDDASRDQWSAWRSDLVRRNYAEVPLLGSMAELRRFAPIESTAPDPSSDEFWSLP